MKDDRVLVSHILEAIDAVAEYTDAMSVSDFSKSRLVRSAVMRELQVIGEAARALSRATKKILDDIPWTNIIGMRNKIIHEYYDVDEEILWATIHERLLPLKKRLRMFLKTGK